MIIISPEKGTQVPGSEQEPALSDVQGGIFRRWTPRVCICLSNELSEWMQTTHFTSVTLLLHPQVALMICFSKTLQHLHFCKEMNYSSRLLPLAEHESTGFLEIFCHPQSLHVNVYLHWWSQGSVAISVTCTALEIGVILETYSAVSVLPAHFCQPPPFATAAEL